MSCADMTRSVPPMIALEKKTDFWMKLEISLVVFGLLCFGVTHVCECRTHEMAMEKLLNDHELREARKEIGELRGMILHERGMRALKDPTFTVEVTLASELVWGKQPNLNLGLDGEKVIP